MKLLSLFTNNLVLLLTLVGLLAFLVSVITEVTKNIGPLAKIPTDLEVIVLSILLCLFAYFTYTSYFAIPIVWYFIVACIIAAFIVAFVAMYGWDKIATLYYRFKNVKEVLELPSEDTPTKFYTDEDFTDDKIKSPTTKDTTSTGGDSNENEG